MVAIVYCVLIQYQHFHLLFPTNLLYVLLYDSQIIDEDIVTQRS